MSKKSAKKKKKRIVCLKVIYLYYLQKKIPNRSKLSPTPSQELFIAGKGGGNLQWLSDMITNQSDLLFIVNTRRIRGVWRFYDTRGTGC